MAVVTIKDVAAEAGVAIATVSRVVHSHPRVAPALRIRVEAAMQKLGYEPNAAAQSMRTRSTRTIACAVRDSSIPELAMFTRAAEHVIRRAGYTLILSNTDEDPAQELDLIKVLSRRRVDGLLMTRTDDADAELSDAIARLSIPVVFIDRDTDGIADSVAIDHASGIAAAVNHLASLGHERIALVTGRPTMRPARERVNAYRSAMLAHGLPLDPSLIVAESFNADQSFNRVSLLLAADNRPTAVIAGGMALLSAVLRSVRLSGLTVGQDISVIAGCDCELAELATPAITAIRWDIPAWGRSAAQLLLDTLTTPMADRPRGRQITLPTELIIRQSCAPPRR